MTLDDGPLALLRFTPVTVDGGDGYDVAATSGAPTGDELSVDRFGHDASSTAIGSVPAVRLRDDGAADRRDRRPAATPSTSAQLGDTLLQLDVELGADDRTDRIAIDGTDGPDQVDAFGFGSHRARLRRDVRAAERRRAARRAHDRRRRRATTSCPRTRAAFQFASTLLGGTGEDQLTGGDARRAPHRRRRRRLRAGQPGADDLDLGAGNDIVRWDEGDGGDTIAAGGGTFDALTMWGDATAESFALEPDGHDARMTAGGEALALDGLERIETVAMAGADTYRLGDLSGTSLSDVIVSLSGVPATPALDGAVDAMTVDGTGGDDALAIAGNTGEARVTGLPVRLAIQRTEPADTLAIAGGAGADTLDTSGLLPGAITATLTD